MVGKLRVLQKPHQLRYNESTSRDHNFENYLSTILFQRGYDRGASCALIQRAANLKDGAFANIQIDDREILRFMEAGAARPGNRLREEVQQSFEERLAAVLTSLSFLNQFAFMPDQAVVYAGHRIDTRPFILWDGTSLYLFDRMLQAADSSATIIFKDFTNPRRNKSWPVSDQLLVRINDIAKLLGSSVAIDETALSHRDVAPASFVMDFVDTHPQMVRLAQMIWRKSKIETKRKLWLPSRFNHDKEQAESFLQTPDAEIVVTNEIIRRCIEQDPIAVLEDYLIREPEDIDEYFIELTGSKSLAKKISSRIEMKTTEYRNQVGAFYCRSKDVSDLDDYLKTYHTRLSAQQIVELMNFKIEEIPMEEDIVNYFERTRAFNEYLLDPYEDHDWQRIGWGLVACAIAAEQILRFLCVYYASLPYFSMESSDGIPSDCLHEIHIINAELHGKGLAKYIDSFTELNNSEQIRSTLSTLLDRDGIWPDGTQIEPIRALWELNNYRIKIVHNIAKPSLVNINPGQVPKLEQAKSLVAGFQYFLDWLLSPGMMSTSNYRSNAITNNPPR
jgi:hypothetical protein